MLSAELSRGQALNKEINKNANTRGHMAAAHKDSMYGFAVLGVEIVKKNDQFSGGDLVSEMKVSDVGNR